MKSVAWDKTGANRFTSRQDNRMNIHIRYPLGNNRKVQEWKIRKS